MCIQDMQLIEIFTETNENNGQMAGSQGFSYRITPLKQQF